MGYSLSMTTPRYRTAHLRDDTWRALHMTRIGLGLRSLSDAVAHLLEEVARLRAQLGQTSGPTAPRVGRFSQENQP
jgi:hypothetical protein